MPRTLRPRHSHGDNGWHVHVHLLMLFDHAIMDDTATNLADLIYKLWRKALTRHGLTASRRHGVDVPAMT
ncbi:MAG: hypothetical protein LC721_02035 [Actinobacteria bacterium]|nr:hypothetical protein [Actinomycetota bacterium]